MITKIINHLKEWGLIYTIGLLFLCILYWFPKITKKNTVTPEYKAVQTIIKNDKIYSQYEVEELTKNQMKKFKDSLQLALKGNVKTITSTIVVVDTVFVNVPIQIDSTEFTVKVSDPYIELLVQGDLSTKSSSVQIGLVDTINLAILERDPLFGRRTVKATVFNANPYVTPTYGTGAILKERRNVLTVGPYIGYDILNQRPSIGIAVTAPVLTLKSRK